MDQRCAIIRSEYARRETTITKPQLEEPYAKKELKKVMRKPKTDCWESTGLDGIRSWMVDKAGETFLDFLLELHNKYQEKGETPSVWYETLISDIYKTK